MANVNRPNGFMPVKLISGAPYNGQMTKFYTDTNCFLGDIMIQDTVGVASGGGAYQGITRATAGTGSLMIGVVVGWEPDPAALDRKYHAGSSTYAVYVCTDPMVVYRCQGDGAGTILGATEVGLNSDIIIAAGDETTGESNMELDEDTTAAVVTAATPLKIVGIVDEPDNEVGVANQKLLVTLNTHVYNGTGVGSLGV